MHRSGNTLMEIVFEYSESNERIYIEKESHGKSARISATSALVNIGASGPALSTGYPVTGSLMILALNLRLLFLLGVTMIRPPSSL